MSHIQIIRKATIRPALKTNVTFTFTPLEPYIELLIPPKLSEKLTAVCARADSRILIASPFVTKKALTQLLSRVSNDVHIKVIVGTRASYLQVNEAERSLGRKIFKDLWGRLHCKIILTDKEVCIGSANITERGIKGSIEASLTTNDPNILNDALMFLKIFEGKHDYIEPDYSKVNTINTPTCSAFVSSIKNLPSLLPPLLRQAKDNVTLLTPTYNFEAISVLLNNISPHVNIEAFVKIDENDWLRGISDPWAIRLLLQRGATVWNIPRLHAKILLIDDKIALVSSLNITNQAFQRIFDAGILTQNSILINSILQFLNRLKELKRLKILRINVEDFEESLAQFNVKAPFLVAQMIQKEGDHFSDEMEEAQPHIENMEVIVHHYPKHAGEELHLPSPPPRLEEIREKIVEIKPADIHEEGVVFIGRKPLVNYFSACSHLFFKLGRKEVKIKARGRFIAKAAHLASIFKSTAINIDHIEIGTSTLIDSTGEIRHVSFIEISLSAPITTC